MKKMEMVLSERDIESFFKVLGKNGVKEAVINVFSSKDERGDIIAENDFRRKARVEFYCPESYSERLKEDILSYAEKEQNDFYLEIMDLKEKINVLKEDKLYNRIKERGVSCL